MGFGKVLIRAMMIAMVSLPALASTSTLAEAPQKPNVILIFVDDLGYGDLGVTGSTFIETPNIDALANEGVLLTDFHASANVCTPSRAGLMTGRYPVRAGLGKQVVYPASTHGLESYETTLAEVFKTAGYRTAMFGKWHLGHGPGMMPDEQGFDDFFGVPYSHDMKPLPLMRGNETIGEVDDLAGLTKLLTDETLAYLDGADASPFFIYLPYTAPHEPLLPQETFLRRSDAGAYGDVVEELDHHVGRILAKLKERGLDDNTLVIFTSDNGPWWEGSAGDHDGRKGGAKDGAYRVPFAARWPDGIKAGTVSDAMAMNIDLLPTLAALVGARVSGDLVLDGKDIWPLFEGGQASPHETLLFFNQGQVAAIRSEQYRFQIEAPYMGYRVPLAKLGKFLLYDMDMGPEQYSVARDHMDVVTDMVSAWHRAHVEFEGMAQTMTGAPDLSGLAGLKIPVFPGVVVPEDTSQDASEDVSGR